MRTRERGQALVLVLILLLLGSLLLIPALRLSQTALRNKQIQTQTLKAQYAMSAGAEYGIWQLLYGDATTLLGSPGEEVPYTVTVNGIEVTIAIGLQVALGDMKVTGAEDNRIRASKTVECDVDGDGVFNEANEDCAALSAQSGMRAKYTVYLEQVSPLDDPPVGLTALYDELPPGFRILCNNGSLPSGNPPQCASGWVTSSDNFLEITTVTPENIQPGGDDIWKWQFASPITFQQQGEVKQFSFLADIPGTNDSRYCNGLFLKLQAPPNEKSDKRLAQIQVGSAQSCDGGGTLVRKFVNRKFALPERTNIFTYMVNVESMENNELKLEVLKDVLPHGGFTFCSDTPLPQPPATGLCDPPMYKIADDPFDPVDPLTGRIDPSRFNDTTGFSNLNNPQRTQILPDNRWELNWDFTGKSGFCALPGGCSATGLSVAQAGSAGDTVILRFQAYVVPTESGFFYNEIFADIGAGCSAPQKLRDEGVTTQADYCASYSWPTGGVGIPTYDVTSGALQLSGQGNVILDGQGSAQLNSWHVN